MQVEWIRYDDGTVCGLDDVDLSNPHFDNLDGVYVIWGYNGRCVRVGQGNIRDRLGKHRNDPKIQQYKHLGLKVTWAKVPSADRDSVETYVANQLNPLVGERFPNVWPNPVNLPTLVHRKVG